MKSYWYRKDIIMYINTITICGKTDYKKVKLYEMHRKRLSTLIFILVNYCLPNVF